VARCQADNGGGIAIYRLRVWVATNLGTGQFDYFPVKDPAHAVRLIDALAESQLLNSRIESNAFGLEEWVGSLFSGEWLEWEDEDGDDIDRWAEKQKEESNG